MRRRDFITILGKEAAIQVIGPDLVRAGTPPKRPIIGIPAFLSRSKIGISFGNAFRQGLQDLGYVLDRDLNIQARNANGDWDRWPAIVEEIVQLKPDVIYAFATVDAVAARKATSTIPIVCAALADDVRLGLIASEARPGGNGGGAPLRHRLHRTSPGDRARRRARQRTRLMERARLYPRSAPQGMREQGPVARRDAFVRLTPAAAVTRRQSVNRTPGDGHQALADAGLDLLRRLGLRRPRILRQLVALDGGGPHRTGRLGLRGKGIGKGAVGEARLLISAAAGKANRHQRQHRDLRHPTRAKQLGDTGHGYSLVRNKMLF